MDWQDVDEQVVKLAEGSADAAVALRRHELPATAGAVLHYCPVTKIAHLYFAQESLPEDRVPWIKAARDASPQLEWSVGAPYAPEEGWVKVAYSPFVRRVGQMLHFIPGYIEGFGTKIPNRPSPLASALASGAVGAGLGYGTGWLAEKLLPETWKRQRLRRTLATLGGLGGAGLSIPWSVVNLQREGPKGLVSTWPWNSAEDWEPTDQALYVPNEVLRTLGAPGQDKQGFTKAAEVLKLGAPEFRSGIAGIPPVSVDAFNRTIWGDPRVTNRLDTAEQAAATSFVATAARMGRPPGQQSMFVTPGQMGRLAAGMGSGYISGALVGKALGALMGMPQETQDRLKRTGMWAGAIKNFLPLVF